MAIGKLRQRREENKFLIVGDSHARWVAKVSPNLDKIFEVTGLVMPGSRPKSITNVVKKDIATLTDPNQG
jgi:hypothetical protein